jgi:RES domain
MGASPSPGIAEIAGHGPQPYALMGAFRSTRQLRLLDLTRPPEFPSYFDEAKHEELGLARFLRSFVDSITQPVIPDGRQHIEYTPTQVLTEYLRWMPENPIDGIALPSAQTGEKTYVLFFDSSAFADADQAPPPRPAPLPGIPAIPDPVFTLAKEDINVYQVKRSYGGAPLR